MEESLDRESLLELGEVYIELLQTFRPDQITNITQYEDDINVDGLETLYKNMYNTLKDEEGVFLKDTITYEQYINMVIKSVEEELKIKRHN